MTCPPTLQCYSLHQRSPSHNVGSTTSTVSSSITNTSYKSTTDHVLQFVFSPIISSCVVHQDIWIYSYSYLPSQFSRTHFQAPQLFTLERKWTVPGFKNAEAARSLCVVIVQLHCGYFKNSGNSLNLQRPRTVLCSPTWDVKQSNFEMRQNWWPYGLPEVIPTKMALYEVAHQFLVPTMLRCEE